MKKILLLLILATSISLNLYAQNGFLRGRIIDNEFNEGLIGCNIYVEGTTNGTVADFNGDYSLPLAPGTYNIVFSSISYATITVSEVKIVEGEVTSLDINMKNDVEQLEAVVVTAEIVKDSEAGLLAAQKKAINVADGISNQTFKKVGDSDLSGAIKRVTGVSVEGGKYVYVRGLGDRYTKTTLNGMDIPGLDPDKNSVQIDIFPTAVLDNVMVYKTFSPNLHGDFTGGVVDIQTRDFPEAKRTSFTIGLSMIPGVQFNDDFILYKGSPTDWLAFDNGQRSLPFPKETVIPSEAKVDPELENLTRSFFPQMSVRKRTALPSGSFTLNTGNQINRQNGSTIGYNFVFNYQNTYQYYSDVQAHRMLKDPDRSETELFRDESRIGSLGSNTVNWSALGSVAIKYAKSSYSLSLLHSRSGESAASKRINRNYNQTGATLIEDILTYSQRAVTNAILIGKHDLVTSQLEWRGAFNYSRVYDPDFRETSISITEGDTSLNVGDGAGINRFYRDLNEINTSAKVDWTLPYGAKSKLKIGGLGLFKTRDFEIQNYLFRQKNVPNIEVDPDWFFNDENIWTAEGRTGTYVVGNEQKANIYTSTQTIFSGYAMTELYVSAAFKTVFGLRLEKGDMYYTGQNNSGSVIYDNEKTLDNLDILPSLNLVYAVNENMNLRGSFNRTLARPSFKELSIAQIYDPITKSTFVGNIDLLQTNINNYDLRWEYFMRPGELVAVSGFYKQFDNHIELAAFREDPNSVKPRNATSSWVYGAEVELRKSLEFIIPALKDLSIGTNFTLVKSFVDMSTIAVDNAGTTEKELREHNARDGEVIGDTRAMAGQSPYIVNAYINYGIPVIDLNINFSYNVQGETLAIVSSGVVPDVFTVPFNSFSFNAFKGFGNENRSRITIGLDNILNDVREQVYQSFGTPDNLFSTYDPGMQVSLKYRYIF